MAVLIEHALVQESREYAQDRTANYVLQAALRRMTQECKRCSASNNVDEGKRCVQLVCSVLILFASAINKNVLC